MIERNEELPDWLIELRDQQIAKQEQPSEQETAPFSDIPPSWLGAQETEDLPPSPGVPDASALPADAPAWMRSPETEAPSTPSPAPAPSEPSTPSDVLEDLREQMLQAEEEFEIEEQKKRRLWHALAALSPGQRLVLALLLFFNVAICGCMGLTMMQRFVF